RLSDDGRAAADYSARGGPAPESQTGRKKWRKEKGGERSLTCLPRTPEPAVRPDFRSRKNGPPKSVALPGVIAKSRSHRIFSAQRRRSRGLDQKACGRTGQDPLGASSPAARGISRHRTRNARK